MTVVVKKKPGRLKAGIIDARLDKAAAEIKKGHVSPAFATIEEFATAIKADARKLKALEEENRKLKKLLAETMLDASTLKEMLGKNF